MISRAASLGILSFIALTATGTACADQKGTIMEKKIRRPAVAGQFYTADPSALRSEIERYMAEADAPQPKGDIVAVVSPHAGYIYSGHVAAWAYSLLESGRYETVVVIAPSHVEYFPFASIYDGDAYETPLGLIPVDKELAEEIAGLSESVKIDPRGHRFGPSGRGEHSLEVQLPFLQVVLGDFKLVPVVMGDQSEGTIEGLGKALAESLAGRRALIVASTDLSHFHDDASARKLDGEFMKRLESFDPQALMVSVSSGKSEACGGGPTAAAMLAAQGLGATRCEVLQYANSGDVSGDRGSVVGYVSAIITRTAASSDETGASAQSSPRMHGGSTGSAVDRNTRIFLLRYARAVIMKELGMKSEEPAMPDDPLLNEKRGGFVTLKKNGRLRGCIGYIEAIKPLVETVEEMALSAAFRDYRFQPVEKGEVDDLSIEISVLSPIRRIKDVSEIDVGKHGIIISGGGRRGLLLPQVAVEYGWDRDTFLDQTCVKAGLPPGAWKSGDTTIEIFSAEIFSEEQFGLP